MKNAKSVLISLSLVLAMLVMGLPGNSVYAGETSVPGEGTEITSGEEQTEPGSGDTGTGTDQGNGETIASDTNQNGAGNTEEDGGEQGDPALTPDNAGGGTDSQILEPESPSDGQKTPANESKNPVDEVKDPVVDTQVPAGDTKGQAGETKDPAEPAKAPAGETEDPVDDADGADEGEEKEEEKVLYPIWVGGVQVTSENCSDILGNKTASYDPEAKTLSPVSVFKKT